MEEHWGQLEDLFGYVALTFGSTSPEGGAKVLLNRALEKHFFNCLLYQINS